MASNAAEKIDVEKLMRDIRARVRTQVKDRSSDSLALHRVQSATDDSNPSPVVYAEELNYLNLHWHDLHQQQPVTSHRKFLGKPLVLLKRFIVNTVWTYLLKDYIERERQYYINLVRFLNSTARYIDSRDASIFWQLVHKIDHDVAGAHERLDRLFSDAEATIRSTEVDLNRRLTEIQGIIENVGSSVAGLSSQCQTLDNVVRGLERTTALFGKAKPEQFVPASSPSTFQESVDYLLLENRYRGSEEEISARMKQYLPLFQNLPAYVLDIGCGRGEFLELLRAAGIPACGIDMDQAMVARCAEKKLDVQCGDGLAYLREQPEKSVGAIFASQVIEHLTTTQLDELLALAASRLAPGGIIALETINPQSVVALCRNFFRDPTHVWPLHPDTMRYLMEMKGLKTEEVRYSAAYPDSAILQPLEISSYLPPRWQASLLQVNQNITRLNDLLFGCQDYCIVAKRA